MQGDHQSTFRNIPGFIHLILHLLSRAIAGITGHVFTWNLLVNRQIRLYISIWEKQSAMDYEVSGSSPSKSRAHTSSEEVSRRWHSFWMQSEIEQTQKPDKPEFKSSSPTFQFFSFADP